MGNFGVFGLCSQRREVLLSQTYEEEDSSQCIYSELRLTHGSYSWCWPRPHYLLISILCHRSVTSKHAEELAKFRDAFLSGR